MYRLRDLFCGLSQESYRHAIKDSDLFRKFSEQRYNRKGQKLLASGKAARAIAVFQKCLLSNNSAENRFNFALALMAVNQYSDAEQYLNKIYNEYPENELNGLALIECLLLQRKWRESENIVDYYKEKLPSSKAVYNYARIINDPVEREKYVSAKEYLNSAFSALDEDELDEALELFLKAEAYLSTNSDILNNIGMIYFKRNEQIKAYGYFERAHKLSPDDLRIRKNLLRTRKKLKRK